MRHARLAIASLLLPVLACADGKSPGAADSTPPAGTARATALGAGEARMPVDGGTIWHRVSGSGAGRPVILLHGGPGFSS